MAISNIVRVRFAPSPTGYLHLGGARTAIFNWAFAKHHNGKFILRIEDTDVERSSEEAEKGLLNDMKWLGILWDEGPEVGGDYGPYRQSERLHIYKEYALKLVNEGKAYYCYCTDEELEAKKNQASKEGKPPHYDGKCRNLTDEEKRKLENEGRKPAIRFKILDEDIILNDLIRGTVEFKKGMVGDFVLLRSTLMPTYNFACVIDDALMKITHVLRAEEHLSNTPRQIMLYKALGFDIPQFGHVSIILGEDKTKLSKRHGAVAVSQYRKDGFLPSAMVNYLALLGWTPKDAQEIFTTEKLISEFDIDRINKAPAAFDKNKLEWTNAHYIRSLDDDTLTDMVIPYFIEKGYDVSDRERTKKIVIALKTSVNKLSDFTLHTDIFFRDKVVFENDEAKDLLNKESSKIAIESFRNKLSKVDTLTSDSFKSLMKEIQKETGIKGKDLWMPIRVALTGQMHGPELHLIAEILGKEKCEKLISSIF